MSVYGDQYFDLCPNRVIRNPITNDMDLRKQVLGFLPLHIQDPTNATKHLSTEKAMPMVDVGMDIHEQLLSLSVLGEKNYETILLKDNREIDKLFTAAFFIS